MIPRPRVDFPQPDSPTSPSVSPVPISNETPSTARTGPRLVPYQTLRSSPVRTAVIGEPAQFPPVDRSLQTAARAEPVRPERDIASDVSDADLLDGRLRRLRPQDDVLDRAPPEHRVQDVVQALPEQGQPGHEGDDGEAREEAGPPDPGSGVGDRALEVVAPLGSVRRLDPVAEEAKRGERENRVRGV